MEYVDLPPEVVESYILPNLPWNDVLRHRRICKWARDVANGYLRLEGTRARAPKIEIVEGRDDRSFRAFSLMDIPTSKLAIRNPSADIFYELSYRNGELAPWLEKYGGKVTELRVLEISFLLYGAEWRFLTGLVNLQRFTATRIGVGLEGIPTSQWSSSSERERNELAAREQRGRCFREIPQVMRPDYDVEEKLVTLSRRVKEFFLGQLKWPPMLNDVNKTVRLLDENATGGSALEVTRLPFNTYWEPHTCTLPGGPFQARDCLDVTFRALESHINKRAAGNLKGFDFMNFHDRFNTLEAISIHFIGSATFLRICESSLKNGVKLHNVASFWFAFQREAEPQYQDPDLGVPVVSLVNLHPAIHFLNLTNVERIEIRSTYRSHMPIILVGTRPNWPKLSCLDITIDGKRAQGVDWYQINPDLTFLAKTSDYPTKFLFKYLFEDIQHPLVSELRLNFANEDLESMAIPKVEWIVASCPNVKKLTIINWPGTNASLVKLFDGLRMLEEITLENCRNVGNVTFVGSDITDPVFLKLKNLKKLSLLRLDAMPKITDLLFDLVIRQLSLSHLVLMSKNPVISITLDGIKKLLEGPFAESIEKFPSEGWSIDNVSRKNRIDLLLTFRASQIM